MPRDLELATRAVIALTALVLLADAIVCLWTGLYLNLGTGVWLALARDVRDGLFYRPIWNGMDYGGTRYFPMLFVPIGVLMRIGIPAVPAGLLVSVSGLLALAVAVTWLLTRWSVPPTLALLGGTLIVAPYFVHQTAFAVRCEPIAAAFAVAGLAVLGARPGEGVSNTRLAVAAALFVGGFASKITCVYAPAAAVAALLLSGQISRAARLAAYTVAGALAFLLAVHVISEGRALDSFRACALAGSDPASLLSAATIVRPIQLIAASHLLSVVFVLALAALFFCVGLWRQVPGLYLFAALAVTGVIFTSPGTIITSQIVDAYAAAIVVLIIATARAAPRARSIGTVALLAVATWAAAQNAVRIVSIARQDMPRAASDRRDLVASVEGCGGSLISESPLIPILGRERPVILDPFAFHVVGLNRPDVARSLPERISRREFTCVILEQDPASPRGSAWYRNVNLSDAVAQAVIAHYALDRVVAGERFYRAR